jgi:hypothetical protein
MAAHCSTYGSGFYFRLACPRRVNAGTGATDLLLIKPTFASVHHAPGTSELVLFSAFAGRITTKKER